MADPYTSLPATPRLDDGAAPPIPGQQQLPLVAAGYRETQYLVQLDARDDR